MVLRELNGRLGSDWALARRLAGGCNEGAYLVAAAGGRPGSIAASPPGSRNCSSASAACGPVAGPTGRTGFAARWWRTGTRCGQGSPLASPRGRSLVALADHIAGTCGDALLSTEDLVHGNLCLENLLVSAAGDLIVVGAQTLGRGTRAYDAAGMLMTAAGFGEATAPGERHLLEYAASVAGPAAFALCAASTALSMADSFLRRGQAARAVAVAPRMERLLARCADLA